MRASILEKTTISLGAGLVILAAVVVSSYRSTVALVDAEHGIDATQATLGALRVASGHVMDVDAGTTGFALTGRQDDLAPYHAAVGGVRSDLEILETMLAGQPGPRRTLRTIQDLSRRRLALAAEVVRAREEQGPEAARRLAATGEGRALEAEIRHLLGDLETGQAARLDQQRKRLERIATGTIWVVTLGGLIAFGLLSGAAVVVSRHLAARGRANEQLSAALSELARRNRETETQSALMDLLQSCATVEEAFPLIGQSMPRLFPGTSGALFVLQAGPEVVEEVARWGEPLADAAAVFPPDACWALRRGRAYFLATGSAGPPCPHLPATPSGGYLCAPMMAQAEALGVLHVAFGGDRTDEPGLGPGDRRVRVASGAAEQIALTLASLRLRESLRNQSIRDPLTGLFNRRYMEESLERELARAARTRRPFGVLMIDLDRFKRFNDTWGHEAGDAVMRAVASFLMQRVRAGDVACRYGGEEFVLILPESSLEETRRRAEELRQGIGALAVPYAGRRLEGITLSVGVAAYPDHGDLGRALLGAADAALYEAKSAGRDRVAVAAPPDRPWRDAPGPPLAVRAE